MTTEEKPELQVVDERIKDFKDDSNLESGKKISSSDNDSILFQSCKKRLEAILQQNRTKLIFAHYTPSPAHVERMQQFKIQAPAVFDNPTLAPRDKWLHHVNWKRNSQMPNYHVHFRYEMQQIANSLCHVMELYNMKGNDNSGKDNIDKEVKDEIRHAYYGFEYCMRGLNFHVKMEERHAFPSYEKVCPKGVTVSFLFDDHEDLHKGEEKVHKAFEALIGGATSDNDSDEGNNNTNNKQQLSIQDILWLMEIFLDFDDLLMAHLGEEEEVVVPLTLASHNLPW